MHNKIESLQYGPGCLNGCGEGFLLFLILAGQVESAVLHTNKLHTFIMGAVDSPLPLHPNENEDEKNRKELEQILTGYANFLRGESEQVIRPLSLRKQYLPAVNSVRAQVDQFIQKKQYDIAMDTLDEAESQARKDNSFDYVWSLLAQQKAKLYEIMANEATSEEDRTRYTSAAIRFYAHAHQHDHFNSPHLAANSYKIEELLDALGIPELIEILRG